MSVYVRPVRSDELYHHGILGMHWGVRRFQNKDGSLTPAGERRYDIGEGKKSTKTQPKKKKKLTAAERKSRTRKILIAAGAVTVAALATYAVSRKIGQDFIGVNLKKGAELQRITPDGALNDKFFASFGKHDNKRYLNAMQAHFGDKGYREVNKMSLKAKEGVKAPSNFEAKKIYKDLLKSDKTFRDVVKARDFKTYDAFNRHLTGSANQDLKEQFAEAIKKRGYNAIIDVNDQKYSGFGANKPLIMMGKSNIDLAKIEKLPINVAVGHAEYNKAAREIFLKDQGVPIAALYTGLGTAAVGAQEYHYQQYNKKKRQASARRK